MFIRESEEELLREFPDFYTKPPKRDDEFNDSNLDESVGLLYEGGKDDKDSDKSEEKPIRPRMNYHFMDGLRGIGAFAVYC